MRRFLIGWVVAAFLCGCSSSDTAGSASRADNAASGPRAAKSGDSHSGTAGAGDDSSGSSGSGSGDVGGFAAAPPLAPGASSGSGASSAASSASASVDAGTGSPGAGVLTAGVWDDGLNYPFFTQYRAANAQIEGDPGFTTAEYDAAHSEFSQRTPRTLVDAALVIDTTGSMGDEILYLAAEFANISSSIAQAFPGADQRWALVLYRDRPDTDPGDAYVVRTFDFTGDLQAYASRVGAQTAGGGGDTPEAPELALAQLPQLSWRSDPAVAKIAFWVADAPHHAQYAPAMKQSIVGAHAAGIHVYPVSASGTDPLLELTMRSTALVTGGRYVFLTDDSGVGDPHKKPEIPCYYVTHLRSALVRAISMELSGTYAGPNPADVIRVSGSPTAGGSCALDDDAGTVQIF